MEPIKLSGYALAKALKVTAPRVNDILLKRRGISPEMGLLLSKYFGMSEQYWINLQADYDRRMAMGKVERQLREIQPHPKDANGTLTRAA